MSLDLPLSCSLDVLVCVCVLVFVWGFVFFPLFFNFSGTKEKLLRTHPHHPCLGWRVTAATAAARARRHRHSFSFHNQLPLVMMTTRTRSKAQTRTKKKAFVDSWCGVGWVECKTSPCLLGGGQCPKKESAENSEAKQRKEGQSLVWLGLCCCFFACSFRCCFGG